MDPSVVQWRRQEATKRLMRLLQLDPTNERALFNLGMLAMDNGDMAASEQHFKVFPPLSTTELTGFFIIPLSIRPGFGAVETKFPLGPVQLGPVAVGHWPAARGCSVLEAAGSLSHGPHQRPYSPR
jgi:hypothetical protein